MLLTYKKGYTYLQEVQTYAKGYKHKDYEHIQNAIHIIYKSLFTYTLSYRLIQEDANIYKRL